MKSLKEKFGKFVVSQKEAKSITGGTPVAATPIQVKDKAKTFCCEYADRYGNLYTRCGVTRTPEALRCFYVY
ncbi:hypothetical protein ACE193_07085 [Bernardetia sp. OM2101]|uniref:hypothetical protein n=1 Tax=Bernardetia sp. OM2101 TaxID=3344876 RepID=UPI0035CF002D